MKKLNNWNRLDLLPYALLYLDEIDLIVSQLGEAVPMVVFRDDEYEYESVEQIIEIKGSRVRELKIVGVKMEEAYPGSDYKYAREISLEVKDRRIWLKADEEFELLKYKLRDVVISRKSNIDFLISPFASMLPTVLAFSLLPAFYVSKNVPREVYAAYIGFVLILLVASLSFIIFMLRNRGVVLERRHQIKSFYKRNADAILMLLLGGVGSQLMAYLYKLLG